MSFYSTQINQYCYVPEGAQKLIWDVFFASRQRGINLNHHFPWLRNNNCVTCITLSGDVNGFLETHAALVIKKEHIETIGLVGLVGLVCVNEKYRGQGLSTHLMRFAKEYGRHASLKAMILWTTKPSVYKKIGFFEDTIDYFGMVRKVSSQQYAEIDALERVDISVRNCDENGVPAFAQEVMKFSYGFESITVCKTIRGQSLADWSGDPAKVVSLIDKTLPASWHINTPEGSDLVCALRRHGYELHLQPGAIRMILTLTQEPLPTMPYMGILNRI